MTRQEEILYMQTRIMRLAADRWNRTDQEIHELFIRYGIYEYIEAEYDSFHLEGDEAVLEEIGQILKKKGVKPE